MVHILALLQLEILQGVIFNPLHCDLCGQWNLSTTRHWWHIIIVQILFAVNSEHEEENRYLTLRDVQNCNDFSDMSCRIIAINYTHKDTKDWKFVTVRVKGPFIGKLWELASRYFSFAVWKIIDSPCNNNTLLDECENFVILCGVANSLLNENDSIIPNEVWWEL